MSTQFNISIDNATGGPFSIVSPVLNSTNFLDTPTLKPNDRTKLDQFIKNPDEKSYEEIFGTRIKKNDSSFNRDGLLEDHNKFLSVLAQEDAANAGTAGYKAKIPQYLEAIKKVDNNGKIEVADIAKSTKPEDQKAYDTIMQRYGLSDKASAPINAKHKKLIDVKETKAKDLGKELRKEFDKNTNITTLSRDKKKTEDLKKARQEFITEALAKFSPEDRAKIAEGFFDGNSVQGEVSDLEGFKKDLGAQGLKFNGTDFEGDGLKQLDGEGKELTKAQIQGKQLLSKLGAQTDPTKVKDALNNFTPEQIESMGGIEEVNKVINQKGLYAYTDISRNSKGEPIKVDPKTKKEEIVSPAAADRVYKAIKAETNNKPINFTKDIGETIRSGSDKEIVEMIKGIKSNPTILKETTNQLESSDRNDIKGLKETISKQVTAQKQADSQISKIKAELNIVEADKKKIEFARNSVREDLKAADNQREAKLKAAMETAKKDSLDKNPKAVKDLEKIIEAAEDGEAVTINGKTYSFHSSNSEGSIVNKDFDESNPKVRLAKLRTSIESYLADNASKVDQGERGFLKEDALNKFVSNNADTINNSELVKQAVHSELLKPTGLNLKSSSIGPVDYAELTGHAKTSYNHKLAKPFKIADEKLTLSKIKTAFGTVTDSNTIYKHDVRTYAPLQQAVTKHSNGVNHGNFDSKFDSLTADLDKAIASDTNLKSLTLDEQASYKANAIKQFLRESEAGNLYLAKTKEADLTSQIKAKDTVIVAKKGELQRASDRSKDFATLRKKNEERLNKAETRVQLYAGKTDIEKIEERLKKQYTAYIDEQAGRPVEYDDAGNIVEYVPGKLSKGQISARQKEIDARNARDDNPHISDEQLVELGENLSYAVVRDTKAGEPFEVAYKRALDQIDELNPGQTDAEIGKTNNRGLSKRQTDILLNSMMIDHTGASDDLADFVNDKPGTLATINRETGERFGYIAGRQHGKGWTSSDSLTLMGSGSTVLHSGNSVTHDLLEAARGGKLELLPDKVDSGIKQSMVAFAKAAEEEAAMAQQKSQIYGQMFQGVSKSLQGMSGSVERLYAAKNGYNLNGVRYDRYS